jgi:phosphate transport system ATP-binding protein
MEKAPELLRVNNLNAWFDDFHAVKNINLSVLKNDIVALIGPSGCGKSTFIRCINRLHEEVPKARVTGEVLIQGENIYDKDMDPVKVRRQVGMVFQKPNPFPGLTIFENVAVGLKLSGIKRKSILSQIVEKSLKQAAIWDEVKDKLNQPGTSLSGGQQQRLCIARALAVNPPILLMDEPTSALDPISTARIEDLLQELKKHVTIVMVTHNMQQASRVSSKTAFFLSGDLIEFGETSQIFTNPRVGKTEEYITGRFG